MSETGVLQFSFSNEEIEAQKNKVTKVTQLQPTRYDHQLAWKTFAFFLFVFCPFLGPCPQHMEAPRLGVPPEL